jgi:hypothetical protein
MNELRKALGITPVEAKQIVDNLPYPLVESTSSYDVITSWQNKLQSCTLEVEEKISNINEPELTEISQEDSPELEYEETATEEIEIKKSDWIAYYGFFRDRDENADRFFETLLDWSKDNPPPATFILCRFDTDGANYVHYVGCIASRADCSKLSLWVGNDFYRYQQKTGTPSEFAKNSGTAPLPQLMTEEMVIDMIDESRFEIIRSIY